MFFPYRREKLLLSSKKGLKLRLGTSSDGCSFFGFTAGFGHFGIERAAGHAECLP